MEIWGKNLLNTMVKSVSNSTMVKTYASYDTLSGALNVLILNKDSINYTANVNLEEFDLTYGGSKMAFTGISPKDQEPGYKWKEAIGRPENLYNVELQANSITVVKLFSPYITLPIQLKSFAGVIEQDKIKLSWQAENEEGLISYEIEHAKKKKEFRKTGVVQAANQLKSYTYFDAKADLQAENQYRLKLIYKNGSVKYSDVVVIKSSGSNAFEIKMFPNPFKDKVNLQIITSASKKVEVTVFDRLGNSVYASPFHLQGGSSQLSLQNIPNLKSGIYFLQVKGDGIVKQVQMLKH